MLWGRLAGESRQDKEKCQPKGEGNPVEYGEIQKAVNHGGDLEGGVILIIFCMAVGKIRHTNGKK